MRIKNTLLVVLNTLACLALAGLAAYRDHGVSASFIINAAWATPLVYVLLILIFTGEKFSSVRHTAVNIAILALCTVFLFVPLPPGTISAYVRWWYPLVLGLIIAWFIDLDDL